MTLILPLNLFQLGQAFSQLHHILLMHCLRKISKTLELLTQKIYNTGRFKISNSYSNDFVEGCQCNFYFTHTNNYYIPQKLLSSLYNLLLKQCFNSISLLPTIICSWTKIISSINHCMSQSFIFCETWRFWFVKLLIHEFLSS